MLDLNFHEQGPPVPPGEPRSWNKVGEIDGTTIRDASWSKMGEVEEIADAPGGAAILLLLL